MSELILKVGREKSLRQRHPWIFSGSVARVNGNPKTGETVEVLSHAGEWLCRAAYSPLSNIRARAWTFDEGEVVDRAFFQRRLEAAIDLRKAVIPAGESDAIRLVHAESDGLPGVIVDRYGDWLVLQCLAAGADAWQAEMVAALVELTGIEQIYERSDVDVRRLEGLPERAGVLRGSRAPGEVEIHEHGLKFGVDLATGQKTGFYIDQRTNRRRLGVLAEGRETLNCFSYTGAFTVYALSGGATSVLSVDSSSAALAAGKTNLQRNGLSEESATWLEGDVFHVLRTLRDQARSFDLVILDPPKFAPTIAQAQHAARGYKDINLLAFKLLRPGGLLFTFSCSGGVSAALFEKIVAGAALDARVDARIIERLSQGSDHPVATNFPEGAYLKGLVVARM